MDDEQEPDDLGEFPEKEKAELNKLIDFVIVELDYNIKPGIGDKKKPFKVDALKHLYFCSGKFYLDYNLEESIRDLIEKAEKCNNGTRGVRAGQVKVLCSELKSQLQSLKK